MDRDGVINIEKHYLHRAEDVEFVDGIFELCRRFQERGYIVIVVTNQSGIARGYYGEDEFAALTGWMKERFKERGVEIAAVYHCPHHPDISGPCSCRKPAPGMLLRAADAFDIDLEGSVLVGDAERDIEAAINAGVKRHYLYRHDDSKVPTKATASITSLKELTC